MGCLLCDHKLNLDQIDEMKSSKSQLSPPKHSLHKSKNNIKLARSCSINKYRKKQNYDYYVIIFSISWKGIHKK